MLSDNLKAVAPTDETESSGNANDNQYHEDNQTQLDEHQTALMVLKAIAESQNNQTLTSNSSSKAQKKNSPKPVKANKSKQEDTQP